MKHRWTLWDTIWLEVKLVLLAVVVLICYPFLRLYEIIRGRKNRIDESRLEEDE